MGGIKLSANFTTAMRRLREAATLNAPFALLQAMNETWVAAARQSRYYNQVGEYTIPAGSGYIRYQVTGLTRDSIQAYLRGQKSLKQGTRLSLVTMLENATDKTGQDFLQTKTTDDSITSFDRTADPTRPVVVITNNVAYRNVLANWLKDKHSIRGGPVYAVSNVSYYRKRVLVVAIRHFKTLMQQTVKDYI